MILYVDGKSKNVTAALRKPISMSTGLDDLRERGRQLFDSGRVDEAMAAFAALQSVNSRDASAYIGLSLCHAARGDWSTAKLCAKQGVESDPDNGEAAARYGQALIDARETFEARVFVGKSMTDFRTEFVHAEMAAMLEFFAGDVFLGVDYVDEAIRRGMPFKFHVLEAAVTTCCLRGELDRARRLIALFTQESTDTLRSTIEREAVLWRAGHEKCRESTQSTAALREGIVRAVESRDVVTSGYMIRTLFAHPHATADDYRFVSDWALPVAHFGDPILSELVAKSAAKAFFRDPNSVAATVYWVRHLVQKLCFSDASFLLKSMLRGCVSPDYSEEIFRTSVLCYRCGGLTDMELQSALRLLAQDFKDPSLESYGQAVLAPISLRRTKEATVRDVYHLIRRNFKRTTTRRPRIAVCLSGQMRSFAQTWPQTSQALGDVEVHVFIAVWSTTTLGIGSQLTIDRVIAPDVLQKVPLGLRATEKVRERYPGLYALLTAETAVSETLVNAICPSAKVKILDERAFEIEFGGFPNLRSDGGLNQAKMYYAMSTALGLRGKHEEEKALVFDAVIRSRPDRSIWNLSGHELGEVFDGRSLKTDHFYHWAVGDQTTLCSSSVADDIKKLWDAIDQRKSFRAFPGASGRAAEWIMGEWLGLHDVRLSSLRSTTLSGLISAHVDNTQAKAAITKDIEARGHADSSDEAFLHAFEDASCRT